MMQPSAISGAVVKVTSSAPSRNAKEGAVISAKIRASTEGVSSRRRRTTTYTPCNVSRSTSAPQEVQAGS
jgi:hypothetical protein